MNPLVFNRIRTPQAARRCLSRLSALLIATLGLSNLASAQDVAIKTNVLSDAMTNINLGAEVGIAPKWTAELIVDQNYWSFSNGKRWKHIIFQPGVRYWLCDRFAGHFFGAHLQGGQYNIGAIDNSIKFLGTDFSKLSDHRYQGWFVGVGVSYGYAWILGKHWNLEGEIGLGYAYTRYDKFACSTCGRKLESDKPHNYVGVTKAAINLVYIF